MARAQITYTTQYNARQGVSTILCVYRYYISINLHLSPSQISAAATVAEPVVWAEWEEVGSLYNSTPHH